MKHQVLFSLKNNDNIFINVVCCSRDWRFMGYYCTQNENLKRQLERLQDELEEERKECCEEKDRLCNEIEELNLVIEGMNREINQLTDKTATLDLEISCYKKLIEGEERK